jgi:CO/xanthine dehydrogenase Mo-binding subunit
MNEVPEIEPLIVDVIDPIGPFGAKALGEPSIVPVAAAIANAVYDATGFRSKELPITPRRVLIGLAMLEES